MVGLITDIDLKDPPVFIVGQNPGRQRKRTPAYDRYLVWRGNRSADLLWDSLIPGRYFLTNVCNYQVVTDSRLEEGLEDLLINILAYKPKKIICLGGFSYKHTRRIVDQLLGGDRIWVVKLLHPSYIMRFNRDQDEFKAKLKEAINA